MTQTHRTLRPLALVALLAILTVSANAAPPNDAPRSGPMYGAWEVTVQPYGAPPITNFAVMNRDGSLVNIDPDPNLSAGIGTWERASGGGVGVTFTHFLSDHGLPIGMLKVRASVELHEDGATGGGPFQTDVILGGVVVQTICGTVEARRVEVEAITSCP